ncbi:MAG: phosphoglycerate mutase (2,3-diphosphoglycerate-independent) [Candidatus Raymondbacteria bacterium RifOxyC12_full_50_8]|uniref:2,3-bisphosphoglycerate-independent phosphoglycerate mutase n=1 Tax=Candidatus Raymondbacteria bacterium RIFOXYD12_FULL_49_13 TaxID=1817890 RepID=A0A1F7F968_UNCRA|nr:MAG: phosphoglycerate mutase (2,3-diphosphoglycerate-independent) [Candidatus Raymondbacteria bacterium RIFOXYA2_FULL_49_16]OGJ91851.1 MAG: phosphoglycerate mutase (2,3-diphosphoglycerate-independent) [Candidatus Raymondbacteria bacterium RifOxyB12_full_50_8]OGJ95490.1 MAG: phosphoglycerate mutase (2,3-diphosphoglycerate-independent) [Candidatus Raymondbacteria bacterium RifOxyC12_full_50_8]OGJ97193.1 MAG: phosphoglycerate mutase (2,3-diphosphoglycerate-independent) [Candidatus Raymondbacteri
MKKPVCLIIRDGWGHAPASPSNGISCAKTDRTNEFNEKYPSTLIKAHGEYVGLVPGNQGNSEVGHLNIGAGRIVYQSMTRITKSIKDGDFFTNPALVQAIEFARKNNSALHLFGLVQDQGVHAVTEHCVALLDLCARQKFTNVLIHAFTDGRDTPPKSALTYLQQLQEGIDKHGVGRVASVMGRYYAMDRDQRWDRTEIAYNSLIRGQGIKVKNWREAIDDAYAHDENDEFIKPRIIDFKGIRDKDAIIFFNYRLDRVRQLTHAFTDEKFTSFSREKRAVYFTAFTDYYKGGNFSIAYGTMSNANIFGEYISAMGLRQLRCAETEKYAHVTFFFNGQREEPYPGEDRVLISSPKVATYDIQPEMSASEVRDKVVEAIKKDIYDVIIVNFANCDMVGHTGVFKAVLKAVKTVDICAGDVVDAVLAQGGSVIVTADHGNAEQMTLADGSPMTAHTTNEVPLILIGQGRVPLRNDGILADIAPTMLQILGMRQPAEMTGRSLILS